MKKLYAIFTTSLLLLAAQSMYAVHNMSNDSITSCADTLYDSGGPGGGANEYSANEDLTFKITVALNNTITLTNMTSIDIATDDTLYIYDGDSVGDPLIGKYNNGTAIPDSVTSTGRFITIRFISDAGTGASLQDGWELYWDENQAPNVTMSDPGPGCLGDSLTFTITDSSFAGSNPTFLWFVNSSPVTPISGDTVYGTSSLTNGDSVQVVIIRDIADSSCYSDTTDTAFVVVSLAANNTPNVTAAADDSVICAGTNVTFTVSDSTNGGADPTFQWKVNGVNMGTDSYEYQDASLSNGDIVTVVMTSNDPGCLSRTTDSSIINMSVTANVTPNVTAAADDSVICAGTNVTFTVSDSTNGGADPTFQWKVNGVNMGTDSYEYQDASLSNGDVVRVVMTSNDPGCLSRPTDSIQINMSVTTNSTPNVAFSSTPSTTICLGDSVTFDVTDSTNGGTTPTFQWKVNGTNSSTGNQFISSSLAHNDVVRVVMTSSDPGCLTDPQDSAEVTMTVNGLPSVNVTGTTNVICNGDSTGTATASGSGGTYTWNSVPSQMGTSASNLYAGTFVVTLVDGNGCEDTAQAIINEPSPLTIGFSVTDVTTFGGSDGQIIATPAGGNGGYLHDWSSGQSTATISSLNAGLYTDTVTDALGCTVFDTARVNQPADLIGATIRYLGASFVAVCDGDNVNQLLVTVAPTGGTGSNVYTWQYSYDFTTWISFATSDSANSYSVNDTLLSDRFIRQRVVDGSGDSAFSNPVFLDYIADVPVSIVGLESPYCTNDGDDVLSGVPSGGAFDATPAYITGSTFSPSMTGGAGGTYNITYQYTDGNSCVSETTVGAVVNDAPATSFSMTTTIFSVNDSVVIMNTDPDVTESPTGGVFSGPGVYFTPPSTYTFDPSLAGTGAHTLYYSFTNGDNCTAIDSVTISVLASSTVFIAADTTNTADQDFCYENNVTVYADLPGDTTTAYVFYFYGLTSYSEYILNPIVFNDTSEFARSHTFDARQYIPTTTGVPGATPEGFNSFKCRFWYQSIKNPGIWQFFEDTISIVNMGESFLSISANKGNSNGSTGGNPFQYCEDLDSVSFGSTFFPLGGGRPVSHSFSILPSGGLTDNGTTADFQPDQVPAGVKTLTYTYTDDASSCFVDTSYFVRIDSLPLVDIPDVDEVNDYCANDSLVFFHGTPYLTGQGVFSSSTLAVNHINGQDSASFFAIPSTVQDNHIVRYVYQDPTTGCVNRDSAIFDIDSLPTLSMAIVGGFDNPALCITDSSNIQITGTAGNLTPGFFGDNISGNGITYPVGNNGIATFQPASAGVGSHTINYTYTDGNGCNNAIDSVVSVNALPDSSFTTASGDFNVCKVQGDTVRLVYTGVSSGTSSYEVNGNALGSNLFDPTAGFVNFDTNYIAHTFTENITGCVNSDTLVIVVDTFPIVSLTVPSQHCYNAGNVSFVGSPASPGGLFPSSMSSTSLGFSENFVTIGTDTKVHSPIAANVGSHTVYYTFTEPSTGCSTTDSGIIVIDTIPTLAIDLTTGFNATGSEYCVNLDSIQFLGQVDIGAGFFTDGDSLTGTGTENATGTGVFAFDPSLAGVNSHTVTLHYTDGNGCYNSVDSTIDVIALPNASFTATDYKFCRIPADSVTFSAVAPGGTSVYTINGSASTSNGKYYPLIDGINGGFYTQQIEHEFTDNTSGCVNNDTITIFVDTFPIVSMVNINSAYCHNAGDIVFQGSPASLGTPSATMSVPSLGINETYFVPGLDTSVYSPVAADTGSHQVKYTFTDTTGCTASDSATFTIDSIPDLSINLGVQSQYCINTDTSNLPVFTGLAGGTQGFGGRLIGLGIVDTTNSASEFAPAVADTGTHVITFEYTDGSGCFNSTDTVVDVVPSGDASFIILSPDSICAIPNFVVQLDAYDTLPTPGSFTITGDASQIVVNSTQPTYGTFVVDTSFVRIDGWNYITYIYSDGNGCDGTFTDSIYLHSLPNPGFVDLAVNYCSNDGLDSLYVTPSNFSGGISSRFESPTLPNKTLFGNDSLFTFTPNNSLVGNHNIKYVNYNQFGCSDSVESVIVIDTIPEITLNFLDSNQIPLPAGTQLDYCETSDYYVFQGIARINGVIVSTTDSIWGPGISKDTAGNVIFEPLVADTGQKTISAFYNYQPGGSVGCFNTADTVVTVHPLPEADFIVPDSMICQDNGAMTLAMTNPSQTGNSVWEVIGGSNLQTAGVFEPIADGAVFSQWNVVQHTFTETVNNNCVHVYQDSIFLDTFPVVNIFIDSLYCSNQGLVSFTATPASQGGGISSVFKSATMFGGFDSTLTAGDNDIMVQTENVNIPGGILDVNHTIWYVYTEAGTECTDSVSYTTVIHKRPDLDLSFVNQVCNHADTIVINVDVNNNPSNGLRDTIYGTGIIDTVANGMVRYDPTVHFGSPSQVASAIRYVNTDTLGCFNEVVDTLYVNPQPVLTLSINQLSGGQINDSVCLFGASVEFIPGINGLPDNLNGSTNYMEFNENGVRLNDEEFVPQLDADSGLDNKMNLIKYVGEDGNGCNDTTFFNLFINPQPVPAYIEPNHCTSDSTYFVDSSYIDNSLAPDQIVSWVWSFDNVIVPDNTGKTQAVKFDNGNKRILLTTTTDKGCAATIDNTILFVSAPIADFTWEFRTECEGDSVQFFNESGPTDLLAGKLDYVWYFGDGATQVNTGIDSISEGPDARHGYGGAGFYNVALAVSQGDCFDSTSKEIAIRNNITTFPWTDDFETVDSDWQEWNTLGDSANAEVFVWDTPNRNQVNGAFSGTNAWVTGVTDNVDDTSYSSNVQTFVTSPCFDLSQMERPMLKLQTLYDLEQNDGVVIQYNTFNEGDTIVDQCEWFNIGNINVGGNVTTESGINWYKNDGIFGNPGNQTNAQGNIGWTGQSIPEGDSTVQWVEARHSLNALLDSDTSNLTKIRFRIAFGSNAAVENEGFAFDDFTIEERTKNVLYELFTNSSSEGGKASVDKFLSIIDGDTNSFGVPNDDLISIQYHTSFPAEDPMNVDNPGDPSARGIYYGVTEITYANMDGSINEAFASDPTFTSNWHELRVLEDPKYIIGMNFANDQLTVTLNHKDVDTIKSNDFSVHIALVEKEIQASELTGTVASSYVSFRNVLKELYPSAAGTKYTSKWLSNETITQNISFNDFYGTSDDWLLVAFIQDNETKEVYQTEWLDLVNTSTGIEVVDYQSQNGIEYVVYPNPTRGMTHYKFKQRTEQDYRIDVFNQLGMKVDQLTVPRGIDHFAFDTENFKTGIYMLILSDGQNVIANDKLIVTH